MARRPDPATPDGTAPPPDAGNDPRGAGRGASEGPGGPPPRGGPPQVTVLLRAWASGDRAAADELFPLIYAELRRISEVQLRRSAAPITLQPTEILHEAYVRLADQSVEDWQNRAHFYALAATVVRRVLLDHARHRLAQRRDRRAEVPLESHHLDHLMSEDRADELIQLHEALEELARLDSRRARVVELRYFGGLSVEETAAIVGVGSATVKRDWAMARAWLRTRVRAPHHDTPA